MLTHCENEMSVTERYVRRIGTDKYDWVWVYWNDDYTKLNQRNRRGIEKQFLQFLGTPHDHVAVIRSGTGICSFDLDNLDDTVEKAFFILEHQR